MKYLSNVAAFAVGVVPIQNCIKIKDGWMYASGYNGRAMARINDPKWKDVDIVVDADELKRLAPIFQADYTIQVTDDALVVKSGGLKLKVSTTPPEDFDVFPITIGGELVGQENHANIVGLKPFYDTDSGSAYGGFWTIKGVAYAFNKVAFGIRTMFQQEGFIQAFAAGIIKPEYSIRIETSNEGATIFIGIDGEIMCEVRQGLFVNQGIETFDQKFTAKSDVELSKEDCNNIFTALKVTNPVMIQVSDNGFSGSTVNTATSFNYDLKVDAGTTFGIRPDQLRFALASFLETGCKLEIGNQALKMTQGSVVNYIIKLQL